MIDSVAAAKERRHSRGKKRRWQPGLVDTEHTEQANLISRAFLYRRQIPELALLFAIPNQGAARLKNLQTEGVLRGVFDLFLAVPRCKLHGTSHHLCDYYHGMFIEMKRKKGSKVSPEQYDFAAKVTAQGYSAHICYGCEEAWKAILNYLGAEPR